MSFRKVTHVDARIIEFATGDTEVILCPYPDWPDPVPKIRSAFALIVSKSDF